jgi:iron complex outermembrane receptor protein
MPVALAQPTQLEEILVTARKRSESYQDVPVTVTAFNAEEIENAGIERPQDYINLTPNATMVQTQNQGTSFITVRGISQARNSEPSVAVLIDGVLMANPSQFNQELYDLESIEVLKGPQGALYGRNAIGGAIIVNTREPTDEFEGSMRIGIDNGFGYRIGADVSGPLADTNVKYRASVSWYDTEGYIDNPYLGEEADPFEDFSARLKLLSDPTDNFTADLRLSVSLVDTQALYFNITGTANDTSLPVRVNNPGVNERDMFSVSLKLDYESAAGTLTSITAWDSLEELLTGDQFDFLPNVESVLFNCPLFFCGIDQAQHQWLDVEAISQEFRFTSPSDNRLRWIVGAYLISTDRFISTGNVFDCSESGAIPGLDCAEGTRNVKRTALPIFAPQASFLSDSQDNFAWALFGEVSYDLTDALEASLALRYDHDHRENTTETPQAFLTILVNPFVDPDATEGQVRKHDWDDVQPKVTLRYRASEDWTLFGGYSRGFRSGGFNQTGVGSAGIAGVDDLFEDETADTFELGAKAQFFDRRLSTTLSLFHTTAKGSYFFVFDPNTSTQNLGNLDKVRYQGLEFDATALVTEGLDMHLGIGYTDSKIKESARNPADIGNEAPLVSRYTLNLGMQYERPLTAWQGVDGFFRADYGIIGPTYWYPDNVTVRRPVGLLDLRGGVRTERWSLTLWSKNLTDNDYNTEWSPGPNFGAFPFPNPGYRNNFVFKGTPRRYGADFVIRF